MRYLLEEKFEDGNWFYEDERDEPVFDVTVREDGGFAYRMAAIEDGFQSAWSNVRYTMAGEEPTVPAEEVPSFTREIRLVLVEEPATVSVEGFFAPGADYYEWRTRLTDTDWTEPVRVGGHFIHRFVPSAQSRRIAVRACNEAGCSDWMFTAAVIAEVPGAPGLLPPIRMYTAPDLLDIQNPDHDGNYVVDWE